LKIKASGDDEAKEVVLKIITTRVSNEGDEKAANGEVEVTKKVLRVPCGGGGWLELLEVQPPGKKAMPTNAFINGIKGSTIFI
jgi:methionyl-tRNA formyltransferase